MIIKKSYSCGKHNVDILVLLFSVQQMCPASGTSRWIVAKRGQNHGKYAGYITNPSNIYTNAKIFCKDLKIYIGALQRIISNFKSISAFFQLTYKDVKLYKIMPKSICLACKAGQSWNQLNLDQVSHRPEKLISIFETFLHLALRLIRLINYLCIIYWHFLGNKGGARDINLKIWNSWMFGYSC